jgi:predicted alpha/beta hydrolase family esterase
MKNAIILHGTDNTPEGNWFRWLEKELKSRGYEVWLPQLLDADLPDAKKYNQFLLNHGFDFNHGTILIGHSSGAVAILNLLQELPENVKIKAAFLVGAFKGPLGKESRSALFPKPFDFAKIMPRCGKFVFIHSDNDPYCPLEDAEFLSEKLGGELIVQKGQGHFNLEAGPQYKKFPFLLEIIDKYAAAAGVQ